MFVTCNFAIPLLSSCPLHTNFVQAVSKIQQRSLTSIGEMMNRIIDFKQAEYDVRPTIMVGVDPELDRLRRDYDGLSSFLEKIAQSIIHQVPEWAAKHVKSCIFLPQVGFLIAMERNDDTELSSFQATIDKSDIWEQFFIADGAVHYKNNRMRHLDEQFGDIYCDIAGIYSSLVSQYELMSKRQRSRDTTSPGNSYSALPRSVARSFRYLWRC